MSPQIEATITSQVGVYSRYSHVNEADLEDLRSDLRIRVMERLAVATGGTYVRSAPGDFGLDRIFDQGIAQLKRDEQESRMTKAYEDRFAWFLGVAFLALALEALLSERGRRNGEAPA